MAVKKEKAKTTKKATRKKATKEEVFDEFLSEAVGLTVTGEVKVESDRTVEEYREKMEAKKAAIEEIKSIEDFVSNTFDDEVKTKQETLEKEEIKVDEKPEMVVEEKQEPVVEEKTAVEPQKKEPVGQFEVTVESLRAKIEVPNHERKTSKQVYGYNCMGIIYDD